MEMKWNPIVNRDLSEVPRNEDVIFTVLDKYTGEVYTAVGTVNDFFPDGGYIFAGKTVSYPVDKESLKAWIKLPHEPFEPGRCDDCTHGEQGIDNFGDHWSKCKLLDNVPFSQIISLKGCPLDCHWMRRWIK